MLHIKRKTKEEIEEDKTNAIKIEKVTVVSTKYHYWACDDCGIAFFDQDLILKASLPDGFISYRCPNVKKERDISTLFKLKNKTCGKSIYGGNEEVFKKYYKIDTEKTNI